MKTFFPAGLLAAIIGVAPTGTAVAADPAETPAYNIFTNVSLVSDYRVRGLAQTDFKPAFQGGFDFVHANGFYLGNFNSNVSWISDAGVGSASAEISVYGGYKIEFASSQALDLGVLHYHYPGNYAAGVIKPHTTELYGAYSYGPAMFKYSHSVDNYFGFANSKNSHYVEFNLNYPIASYGLTINTHVGYQKIKGQATNDFDYTDWKLGLSKDLGNGFTAAVSYIDTNAKDIAYNNYRGKNLGKATGVVSLTKAF